MKIVIVQYEPDTIFEDQIEEMETFDPAYFDTNEYRVMELPKDYEYFASSIASMTEHGLKYKLFELNG